MASIHHATVKSANAKGYALTYDEDANEVTAHHVESNRRVTLEVEGLDDELEGSQSTQTVITERAKDAMGNLADILDYEADEFAQKKLPSRIEQEDGDFVAYYYKGRTKGDEIARDPDLADLFETLRENGHEEEEDDEPETSGSVVPDKYKKLYKERGNPNHCGDWLAETLAKYCRVLNEKGKEVTDIDRLEAIANANGVAPERFGKLGVETNGWQGRFRMTVRNLLTKVVADKGFLLIPEGAGSDSDLELKAPREWCAEHATKEKSKAGPKAAVAKNPGAGKASAKTRAKKGK